MKRALPIFTILLSLSCNLLAGLQDVRISIEPNAEKMGHYVLRIRNDGTTPVSYWGYGGEGGIQPVYEKEVKKGERWVEESPGWCGNGMGPCQIEGKKEIRVPFQGMFPSNEKGLHFKVNILMSAQDVARWDQKSATRVYSPIFSCTYGKIEQAGADQPATAPESKPEGKEKPKPESKGHPQ